MPFLVTLLFIINPVLSFPLVFIELINKKKYANYLFAIAMGLLGFILIPGESADITRLYDTFNELNGYNFHELIEYLHLQPDFVFFLYAWILGKLEISKQFLQFTSLFIVYFLFIKIYLDWSKSNNVKKRKRIIFLFFIMLFITFVSTYSGIRNNTALSFFIYGIYQFEFNKKKSGIIYLILGNLTHFMTIILTILFMLSRMVKINPQKIKYLYFASFLFLFLPVNPLINWLSTINVGFEFIESRQYSYLGGSEWSSFFLSGLSIKGKIFFIFTLLPYFLTLIYLATTNYDSNLRKFAYSVAIFTNLLSAVPGTLYKRYCTALIFIGIVLLLYEYKDILWYKTKISFIYIYMLLFLVMRVSDIYTMRYSVSKSYNSVFTYNLYSFLNKEIKQTDYINDR